MNFRPTIKIKSPFNGVQRELSYPHEHEFGKGYDLYYKDESGRIIGEMHGLKPEEAEYLALLNKLKIKR